MTALEARCEDCRYCQTALPEGDLWYCSQGIGRGGQILRPDTGTLSFPLTRVHNCSHFASRFVRASVGNMTA
jgi:hypothetical protein